MSASGEQQPDPGGVQAAIDRYRDLAKYLITVFAAVGGLLLAGTQLSSIGKLSFEDTPWRVVAVVLGLIAAIGAVASVMALALRVLRPVEMSLDDVLADSDARVYVDARPSVLAGAASVNDLHETLAEPLLTDDELVAWREVAGRVVALAAFRRMQTTFDGTWRPLLGAAIVGALGITAFTWGANPPAGAGVGAEPVVRPAPVRIDVSLTAAGRETLAGALGKACVTQPVGALTIGGSENAPRIVTLPQGGCRAAQFTLQPEWGAAVSSSPR